MGRRFRCGPSYLLAQRRQSQPTDARCHTHFSGRVAGWLICYSGCLWQGDGWLLLGIEQISSLLSCAAMDESEVVIASVARTPVGSFLGSLSSLSGPQLGAIAIRAAVERARLAAGDVDELIMGQVLSSGAGQAPARQAALGAGLPVSVPCTTVDKVCGSGLYAVMQARRAIALGEAKVVVAGGMESMSQAPYLLPGARQGYRMGHQRAIDSLIYDGLWDPYNNQHMGNLGELCARKLRISRQAQDDYAVRSYERAQAAQRLGKFAEEMVAVEIERRRNTEIVDADEEVGRFERARVESMPPVFQADGTITVVNSSKISDGAAAVVLMSRAEAERRGCPVLATWIAEASFAQDPAWYSTAPAEAIRRVAEKGAITVGEIDLFEINEAFAVVVLAAMEELGLSEERVNVYGGAISLGHPIGCSAARTLVTLISALRASEREWGCVSICLGGGEAVAGLVRREG
ncbi:MAG: thiolase family protein [Planctomycetales bacterium]|nr:thiolase family protein [Planctomycetales bacterium]